MYELKVGAGKANINVPEALFPFRRYENVFLEGSLGDLYAKAIVLDNGKTRFLFVNIDAGDAYDDKEKQDLCDRYGFELNNILFFGTHNHSAPNWGSKPHPAGHQIPEDQRLCMVAYEKVVKAGVTKAIDDALNSLRPARYGFGTGESYINTNRDQLFEDGFWMQGQNYAGFSDKTLAVMKFEDLKGHLIGAVLNYCCHGTNAFVCKDVDGKVKSTPEFSGYACEYVSQRYGGDPVILWSSGCAGDQNPLFSSEGFPRVYEPDGYSESVPTPPGTQYVIQKHWGYTHGIDAIRTIESIKACHSTIKIHTTATKVTLPTQHAPQGADMQYNRLLVDNFLRKYRPELYENGNRPEKKLVEMVQEGTTELIMQLAILGDTAFVGVAAEPYCKIGMKMKDASPFKNTVIMTHTDGRKAGYIIGDDSLDHKVFQSFSKVHPGGNDQRLVDGMLNMFETILN